MSHFNEHALEMSIMELFQQEGYIYTNGEEINKMITAAGTIVTRIPSFVSLPEVS